MFDRGLFSWDLALLSWPRDVDQFVSQAFHFGDEKRFKSFGAFEKRRFLRIVVPAIVEDFRHVADEFAEFLVVALIYSHFYGLEV